MTEIITGIAATLGGIAVVLWRLWRRAALQRDEAEGYRDTRKRMDEADGDVPRVPGDAREWLRKREKK